MSTLHSRLPDTGSIGPGIHSSSKGSVCGDLKLSAIFEICVHPICHKNECTSVHFSPFGAAWPIRGECQRELGRALRGSPQPKPTGRVILFGQSS